LSFVPVDAERERDGIKRRLVLLLGHRNGESRSIGLPRQREKGAALTLDSDRLRNKLDVYAPIETNHQAARRALNHPRTLPEDVVSLLL
jgi:hypothetical protein